MLALGFEPSTERLKLKKPCRWASYTTCKIFEQTIYILKLTSII